MGASIGNPVTVRTRRLSDGVTTDFVTLGTTSVLQNSSGTMSFLGGAVDVRVTRILQAESGVLALNGAIQNAPITGRNIHPEIGVLRFSGESVDVHARTSIDIPGETGVLNFDGGAVSIPTSFRWSQIGNDSVEWTPL
jgi:hypothetical protein